MKKKIRVRFAPSPSGELHIGNSRTALFNWLLAHKQGGTFILRIEDTDTEHSAEKYTASIMDNLRWLGLTWDEGPNIGGEYGPYRQSLRKKIYEEYFNKLKQKGLVYPCYCTEEELTERRKAALPKGGSTRYDNRCRDLNEAKMKELERAGRKPSWRFRVQQNRKITVNDMVHGKIIFDTNQLGDFIVLKSDGSPTFNFAVSVDDMCMEVTHIIRGDDHLSNTPRHILLWEALGAKIPQIAHNTMTRGPDGNRLSKRHGATSISEFRRLGYLPEGLINYMALLGWSPGNNRELFKKEELIEAFSLKGLSRASAVFDRQKLNWIDNYHICQADISRLVNLAVPYLKGTQLLKGPVSEAQFHLLEKMIAAIRARLSMVSESVDYLKIFLAEKVTISDKDIQEILTANYVPRLFAEIIADFKDRDEIAGEEVAEVFSRVQQKLGVEGKQFYQPLRLALTGMAEGPELIKVIPLMDKKKIINRLETALEKRDSVRI